MEDFNLDLNEELPMKVVESLVTEEKKSTKRSKKLEVNTESFVSCLRNEKVNVKFLPKENGIWGNNPKHVLSGGMSEGSARWFSVPKLAKSGMFVNVLTDKEKEFLEEFMGLEYNALSIYKKGHDNFWDDSNEEGINRVRLLKLDNILDLSNPEDYIRYKILLANKDLIAPSLLAYEDTPKESYLFVIISENDEVKAANKSMSYTMLCYKEFGKIEDDFDTLRCIVEIIDARPTSKDVKIEFLKSKINLLILLDSKLFLRIITDSLLPTKVLIKKSIEAGLISNRGGMLYLRKDNTPLCDHNEEPTLNIAAKYLNDPRRLEIKFSLEAQLKQ